MAIIHKTTLTPTKLQLLTGWLPAQLWYLDRGRAPELARAGGFRLDDPLGEVGIEWSRPATRWGPSCGLAWSAGTACLAGSS